MLLLIENKKIETFIEFTFVILVLKTEWINLMYVFAQIGLVVVQEYGKIVTRLIHLFLCVSFDEGNKWLSKLYQ